MDEERIVRRSANSGTIRQAEVKEVLRLMFYANPHTSILQGNKIIRKGNQTVKVTNQLTNGNKIKRRIRNIKYKRCKKGGDKLNRCL